MPSSDHDIGQNSLAAHHQHRQLTDMIQGQDGGLLILACHSYYKWNDIYYNPILHSHSSHACLDFRKNLPFCSS